VTTTSPYTYKCVRCGVEFGMERRHRSDQEIRCATCRTEVRKASKRETWARHGKEYRQTQKAARPLPTVEEPKPTPKHAQQPIPIARPEPSALDSSAQPLNFSEQAARAGSLVSFPIRNGKKVVWIADAAHLPKLAQAE